MDPLPLEEYHGLKETYKLLCHLIDPQKTPKIPKYIRDKARACLRHYPSGRKLEEIYATVDYFEPR